MDAFLPDLQPGAPRGGLGSEQRMGGEIPGFELLRPDHQKHLPGSFGFLSLRSVSEAKTPAQMGLFSLLVFIVAPQSFIPGRRGKGILWQMPPG